MIPWQKIQQENFRSMPALLHFLEIPEQEWDHFDLTPAFPLNLPKRLAEKMAKNTLDDPLLIQFVPQKYLSTQKKGFVTHPVQDHEFAKTPCLIQKYARRVLLLLTGSCAMNCRFCFRQNHPYTYSERLFEKEIAMIEEDSSLLEVILSGGDPLSLSDPLLIRLLQRMDHISHLQHLRLHTRFPIGIPERITPELLQTFASMRLKLWIVLHVNHPHEWDREITDAVTKLQRAGITILMQSVLLHGVNDDVDTLDALLQSAIAGGVIPYYLHMLDPVEGSEEREVPEAHAIALHQALQARLPGYAVPRLVREIPFEKNKTLIHQTALFPPACL